MIHDFRETEFVWPEHILAGIEAFFNDPDRDIWNSALFPLQKRRELERMIEIVSSLKPVVVGEIGSDKGGTLYELCRIQTVRRVFGIEYRGLPFAEHFESEFPHIDFCWVHGSSFSERTVKAVMDWMGNDKADYIFLDGDKCAFKTDFYLYHTMVRKGGLLAMHDVNGEPPQKDWDELRGQYKTFKVIDSGEALEIYHHPELAKKNSWYNWLATWEDRSCGYGVFCL